jgi:protein transport protein SEC61 subunit gamma-like protein
MDFKPKEKLDEFTTSTNRILTVSKKPDTAQYMTMIRITALGLAVLGVLGYIIELVSFLVRTAA